MSDDLKIPKLPVTVELAVAGQGVRRVSVFVAEHKAASAQRQRVLDLLEAEPQFLPAVEDGGTPRLFNKAVLQWVGIPLLEGSLPVEEDGDGDFIGLSDATLYDVRQPVVVELDGGEELVGDLLYSPPPEQARVVDYLNRGGRFLRLWTSERVLLINKEHIVSVRDQSAKD